MRSKNFAWNNPQAIYLVEAAWHCADDSKKIQDEQHPCFFFRSLSTKGTLSKKLSTKEGPRVKPIPLAVSYNHIAPSQPKLLHVGQQLLWSGMVVMALDKPPSPPQKSAMLKKSRAHYKLWLHKILTSQLTTWHSVTSDFSRRIKRDVPFGTRRRYSRAHVAWHDVRIRTTAVYSLRKLLLSCVIICDVFCYVTSLIACDVCSNVTVSLTTFKFEIQIINYIYIYIMVRYYCSKADQICWYSTRTRVKIGVSSTFSPRRHVLFSFLQFVTIISL